MPRRRRTPRRLVVERLELRQLLAGLEQVYFENFENGDGEFTADNTGGSVLGLWHYSVGRRNDNLPNHSPTHNWYYGAFESAGGGGRYDVLPFDHQGTLTSPPIQLPDCGPIALRFSYVLDTRPELDRDFVTVYVVIAGVATPILSRQDGTLPESGLDQWLTGAADLSAFRGQEIRLVYEFRTGTPPPADPEGWYVDDISITSECAAVDLSVVKTVDDATPNELQTVTYTIVASNAASSMNTIGSVTVSENLPAGVTFVSAMPSEGSYDPQLDVWTGLTLAPGEVQTLTIVAQVNAGTAGQTLVNTAIISGSNGDPNNANNSSTATVTVNSVDVSVAKTASDLTPNIGQTLTYTLSAANAANSNAPATGVVVTENLPAGVTFVSAIASEGMYDPATDLWTGLQLAPGELQTVLITVTVNAGAGGQCLTNIASIMAVETDPNVANNSATVQACVPANAVDLSVSKSVSDASPDEGQSITYTITVTNALTSNAPATGIVITDNLPAGVTLVSSTATEGTYSSATDQWTGVELAPGESATLSIVVVVDSGTSGQVLTNTAQVGGPDADPDPGDNQATATAVVNSIVQFITPLSLYRTAGPFTAPAPTAIVPPAAGKATIAGFKWHDLDQDGVWDVGEPGRAGWSIFLDANGDNVFDPLLDRLVVTATDGSYVFADIDPGTYFIREDRAGLSDGTIQVQPFPAADPGGLRDPDEHRVTVVAGQTLAGTFGAAIVPSFGSFEYSPLIRPADDNPGRFATLSAAEKQLILSATSPWQSFLVKNTTGRPLQVTTLNKVIDATIVAPAAQFISVFQRNAVGTLIALSFPIAVPAGQSLELFAFYDPAIRSGDTVTAQYPDWFDDPSTAGAGQNESQSRPPHTLATEDRLEVVTAFTDAAAGTGPTFAARLVGGSTYDSDIFYDSRVENADVSRLADLLAKAAHEPTSDANARFPNGAQTVVGSSTWPVAGAPQREIGSGDFAPLNVEFGRTRAPFLDLDPDNSNGARGADFVGEFAAGAARIADADASFSNRLALRLASVKITIVNPLDGAQEDIAFASLPAGITMQSEFSAGMRTVTLTGPAAVESFALVLRGASYTNLAASPAPGSRQVRVESTGSNDFLALNPVQTATIFDQRAGNVALATVVVKPAVAAAAIASLPPAGAAGEGEELTSVVILATEGTGPDRLADLWAAPQGPLAPEIWSTLSKVATLPEEFVCPPAAKTATPAATPANALALLAPVCDHEEQIRELLFAHLAQDDLDLGPDAD